MNVKKELLEYIGKELLNQPGSISEDDNLLEDDMIDSLGIIRLVSFIEETFKLKIPMQDLVIENFYSVNAIATYLESINDK